MILFIPIGYARPMGRLYPNGKAPFNHIAIQRDDSGR